MDIYTKIGEENFVILFKLIFKDYINMCYGTNAKFKFNNHIYKNTDDLLNAIFIYEDGIYLNDIIYDFGYIYIYKLIKRFIDKCPFDIFY